MTTTSTTTGVQSILQQWKNFDLTSLQRELDETAGELANRQDESENSRKKLVDQSRDFKKNTPEDVRKQVTPLLKSFQAEIDSLSKRSKAAEASFLTLYKKIIEAPDPVPAMEQILQSQKKVQRYNEMESENRNLRATLEQYNAEFAEIKNQEVTIRQLKERIKCLEEQADSIVEARVAEQETSSKRFYDERERESREENEALSQKLKQTEERANALQTSLNAAQSELFVLRSRGDEVGSAKASEMELIFTDGERANQRADSAEKECELLREKLRSLEDAAATVRLEGTLDGDSDAEAKKLKAAFHEVELASKDKQIGQLLDDLKQSNGKLLDTEKKHQSERIELTQQLEVAQHRLDEAEANLRSQSDYDEIKRELNVLKSIELGEHDDGVQLPVETTKSAPQKTLETLLLSKNKALQDENASLRNANRELNVHQTPQSSASSFCRDSDDHLSALIDSVSEQRVEEKGGNGSALGGFDTPRTTDHRRKREPTKVPGVQLQNAVKQMACLIGSELVAMYQASEQQSNGSPVGAHLENERMEVMEKPAVDNSSQSQPTSAIEAMAADLLASLRTITPTGFEEAVANGVPREIVEYMTLIHLQQSVAKHVQESAAKGEVLDTTVVAQRCRVALSTHNIGQRLLAKCILNQSQGSVSELLSKPKPWEKLTEKGKESFRRIQAWLSDDSFVELLRMISPKRAYGGFRERYPVSKPEEGFTPEKLTAILSEAHNSHTKPDMDGLDLLAGGISDSASPPGPNATAMRNSNNYSPDGRQTSTPNSTSASGSKAGSAARSSGRYRHDDIPKEMVYEIYRRELEKLQSQGNGSNTAADVKSAVKPSSIGNRNSTDSRKRFQLGFPSLSHSSLASAHRPHNRRLDSKRLSGLGLSFLQRRQQGGSNIMKTSQLLAMRQRSLFANSRRAENRDGMRLPPVRASWSAGRTKLVSSSNSDDTAAICGGMKQVGGGSTEELPQSFSPGGTPIVGTKAFKAVLPPITQEQFEEYNNIDTENLVRKVKDYLTKFSISQRLFGEQVLGLSQGSVSDLLARPKPWAMLTQKGREPFIRMQLFLEDKKALQKLLEKRQQQLPGQHSDTGEGLDGVDSLSNDEGSPNEFATSFTLPTQVSPLPTQVAPVSAPTTGSRSRRKPALPRVSMAAREGNRPRELSGIAALLQCAMRGGNGGTPSNDSRSRNIPSTGTPARNLGAGHTSRRYIPASSIPEPAEPIDTKNIVAQVKALLLTHNIGQKVFGATVLDMSQGAVSDLLSKTKPWELLSARGREAMLRMKAWLEDPNRLEKVFQGRAPPTPRVPSLKRPAADTLLSSTSGFYNDGAAATCSEAKKTRVVLTDEQREILKSAYDDDSYPSTETVTTLAHQLGLSVRTIVNWFHNRRMRSKPPPGSTEPTNNTNDEMNETVSDDGTESATAFGTGAADQYYTYDELAYAHAQLARFTEEDDDSMGNEAGDQANYSAGEWAAGGNPDMENLGWTGDSDEVGDEPVEDSTAGEDMLGEPMEQITKEEPCSSESGDETAGVVEKPRRSLLERMEQSVKREEPAWDPEEPGRTGAIARLEQVKRALEQENCTLHETLTQHKSLVDKLEDDLLLVNALKRPEAVGAESPDDVTRDFLAKAVSAGGNVLTDSSAADSLLPIVAGQRERFRQRVQEVEEQNLQYQQHMALLQSEIERSRADSVKLYEKIKFLQSYRGTGQSAVTMADDQTLEKYSSEYERSLDPFRRFGLQERQRKYHALRTHDKATLRISRMIMSSGVARAFFFFYLLFLHCLVFLVLYKIAYTESCKRDFNTECVQKFKEHMHQVHGVGGHNG